MPKQNDVQKYQNAIMAAAGCAHVLAQHDLPTIIASIKRAQTTGPLTNPKLFKEKSADMALDRELLEAANVLREYYQAFKARVSDQNGGK